LRGTLRGLAAENGGEVCVVPIAFVSDHEETLGEINHEARELAGQLGITRFEMTAGLNDSPTFMSALADLVLTCIGNGQQTRNEAEELVPS
jgi:ferrochelatase